MSNSLNYRQKVQVSTSAPGPNVYSYGQEYLRSLNNDQIAPVDSSEKLKLTTSKTLLDDQRWHVADEFEGILHDYSNKPRPLQEVYAQVSRLFNHDPELLSGFQEFMLETYSAQNAKVLAAQAKRDEAHRLACEQQSSSSLLTLPREIRDKIWDELTQGNVIHVSPKLENSIWGSLSGAMRNMKRQKTSAFCFHACRAEKGVGSSA